MEAEETFELTLACVQYFAHTIDGISQATGVNQLMTTTLVGGGKKARNVDADVAPAALPSEGLNSPTALMALSKFYAHPVFWQNR